jgi:hypothetical protein
MDFSRNGSGRFFVAGAPTKRYLQVGCWPHISFGSEEKKEKVNKSLFVNPTNKFKALNFSNSFTVYNGPTSKN